MNKDKIETNRLILRQLSESDLDDYYHLETDPGVKHYVGGPLQHSKEALRYTITQSTRNDMSLLAVIQKSSNQFVGRCGLIKNDSIQEYEIHIVLAKKFWVKVLLLNSQKSSFLSHSAIWI